MRIEDDPMDRRYQESRFEILDRLKRKAGSLRSYVYRDREAARQVIAIRAMIEQLPDEMIDENTRQKIEAKISQLRLDVRDEIALWFKNFLRCEPNLDRHSFLLHG